MLSLVEIAMFAVQYDTIAKKFNSMMDITEVCEIMTEKSIRSPLERLAHLNSL